MRRVRRVTAYTCTSCFTMFPTSSEAKAHVKAKHPAAPAQKAPRRPRETQTAAILRALQGGASTAEDVVEKTSIPMGRTHSLLSYHRRRGNVAGYSGKLRLTAKGKKALAA